MAKHNKAQPKEDASFDAEQLEKDEHHAETESGHSRPAIKFSGSGGLNVAVWKQKTDQGFDRYSIKIERNYKDENDTFQSTQYLRDTDLLRTQQLLIEADRWIEQEKQRGRVNRSGPSEGVHY